MTKIKTAKLFVWIKGFQGPEPQIWPDVDNFGKPKNTIYAKHELDDGDARSLNELIKDYPCPDIANEAKP